MALALSFAVTGCGAGNTQSDAPSGAYVADNQGSVDAAASSQPADTQNAPAPQSDDALEQAKNAALAHAGLNASDVTFVKEKLDYDDGIAEYDIEFVTAETKYEYEVRANDAAILKAEQEPVVQVNQSAQAQGGITLEEAKTIALTHAGLMEEQIRFSKQELDYDDGIAEYEIEFYEGKKEYSYSIDAASGKILEAEVEID